MSVLVDTGILLRLIDKSDLLSNVADASVTQLVASREQLFVATQNLAELWNVSTRPISENGLGLSPDDVLDRIRATVEPLCGVLREHRRHYEMLKRLAATHQIIGKQIHDARLVATMLTWRIETILTLNDRHFRRYAGEGIRVETPQELLGRKSSP